MARGEPSTPPAPPRADGPPGDPPSRTSACRSEPTARPPSALEHSSLQHRMSDRIQIRDGSLRPRGPRPIERRHRGPREANRRARGWDRSRSRRGSRSTPCCVRRSSTRRAREQFEIRTHKRLIFISEPDDRDDRRALLPQHAGGRRDPHQGIDPRIAQRRALPPVRTRAPFSHQPAWPRVPQVAPPNWLGTDCSESGRTGSTPTALLLRSHDAASRTKKRNDPGLRRRRHGVTPVTVVEAGPCTVMQVRGQEKRRLRRRSARLRGHARQARQQGAGEFRPRTRSSTAAQALPPRGAPEGALRDSRSARPMTVDAFSEGRPDRRRRRDHQGPRLRRHDQAPRVQPRGPKTHGSMNYRRPGSIGCSAYPGRVFKGKRMSGHYGDGAQDAQEPRGRQASTSRAQPDPHQGVAPRAQRRPSSRCGPPRRRSPSEAFGHRPGLHR